MPQLEFTIAFKDEGELIKFMTIMQLAKFAGELNPETAIRDRVCSRVASQIFQHRKDIYGQSKSEARHTEPIALCDGGQTPAKEDSQSGEEQRDDRGGSQGDLGEESQEEAQEEASGVSGSS